jgi:ABC-type branched-subunit amino acid transport system ATPase component
MKGLRKSTSARGAWAVLDISALNSSYGRVPVLRDVSFRVGPADFLGILGHNGAGKSSLLKTVIGFIRAAGGTIELDNKDITRDVVHIRASKGLGYVPQGRQIFPGLTVRENLSIATQRSGRKTEEILLRFPRLVKLLDRPGGALSGGEQQLLALARCLATSPRIILLDEPTEGIQPSIIEEMVETLKSINEMDGVAVVLVEQNLEFLSSLADRILILKRGRIVEELIGNEKLSVEYLSDIMM